MPVYGRPRGIGGPASASGAGSLSAVDFGKLATVPAASPGIMSVIETGSINLLATSSNNAFAPAYAGKYFIVGGIRTILLTLDGTLTSPPTLNIGNNAAKTNIAASQAQPVTANFATALTAGAPFGVVGGIGTVASTVVTDMTTGIKLDVTVAAVAGTATVCTVKIQVWGYFTSIP